jgi:hypothetical protein
MVVKGAVKGFEEWEADKASQAQEAGADEVVSIPVNEELDGMVNEDPVDLITAEQGTLGGGSERAGSTAAGCKFLSLFLRIFFFFLLADQCGYMDSQPGGISASLARQSATRPGCAAR